MNNKLPEVIARNDDGQIYVKGKIDRKTAELVAKEYGFEGGVSSIEYMYMRAGRDFCENRQGIYPAKKGRGAFLCTEITPK